MPVIEAHFCNICKRNGLTVYAFNLKNGEYIQLCYGCMAAMLSEYIEHLTDEVIKKHLEKS